MNQVWSAFLFVFLEITSQEILLQFWSKEILSLILSYCPHISSKRDRHREDSSPKIQRESDESFLLLLWGSGLPAAANCVELYSSQRWQEQLWLQSPCRLRDDLLWVICHGLSQLCFCATSSNKWEALHNSEHRPPAEQHHLSLPSTLLWSSTCTARATWQQSSHVTVTSLVSCDKAVFWQEKAVKPWWPGARQGLSSSKVKAAVNNRAGGPNSQGFCGAQHSFYSAVWRYSVTTPVCGETQGHKWSCVTAAQDLLSWQSVQMCACFCFIWCAHPYFHLEGKRQLLLSASSCHYCLSLSQNSFEGERVC